MKFLEDYYLNGEGNMVFTEAYHLKRGYCCGSGCLHCPYDGISVENTGSLRNADTISVQCPFCFETFQLPVLSQEGEEQKFVYDCEVCCNPIEFTLHFSGDEFISVDVEKSN